MTTLRAPLYRWVMCGLTLLMVVGAGLGTSRAALNAAVVAAAVPLLEPEAELKAMPAVERQLRRTHPAGDRFIEPLARHVEGARSAADPAVRSRLGHRNRPRAPPHAA